MNVSVCIRYTQYKTHRRCFVWYLGTRCFCIGNYTRSLCSLVVLTCSLHINELCENTVRMHFLWSILHIVRENEWRDVLTIFTYLYLTMILFFKYLGWRDTGISCSRWRIVSAPLQVRRAPTSFKTRTLWPCHQLSCHGTVWKAAFKAILFPSEGPRHSARCHVSQINWIASSSWIEERYDHKLPIDWT